MQQAILNFLNPILEAASDPLQFAYKSKRSTLDAITILFHHITFSLDKAGGQLRCTFLDFSSPIYRVRESLAHQSPSPGLGSCRTFEEGLLQESVLSPLLFIIFINDLVNQFYKSTMVSAYVDDLALAGRGPTRS